MAEQTHNETPSPNRRRRSPLKLLLYTGIAVGALFIVCGLALLLFHDPILDGFVKPRITAAFLAAYPEYSLRIGEMKYSIRDDSFRFDSISLSAADGMYTNTIASLSLSGISWMHYLWGGTPVPHDFENAVVDAQAIALGFPQSQYVLRCERIRASIADSELTIDALEVHPAVDDEEFFAESKFRQTRFKVTFPQCRLSGVAFLEALDHKSYRARSVHARDIGLDILSNKDRPAARDSSSPPMPGESLSSMSESIRCDTVDIINASLTYGERFSPGSKAAAITFDSVDVLAEGIVNHTDRNTDLVVNAKGRFMKAGTMNMVMSFPVPSPSFSFRYSGSLTGMELSPLNAFLETAEQNRIKSGFLHAATFEINVASGRASGSVRAVYKGLTLAAINKKTGSENGFLDGITSYIANTYKIRGTNLPDKSGSVQIGKVKYTRQRDDPFFRFVWFALRSGLADVVGF